MEKTRLLLKVMKRIFGNSDIKRLTEFVCEKITAFAFSSEAFYLILQAGGLQLFSSNRKFELELCNLHGIVFLAVLADHVSKL
jgi:hypothetical protein